MKQFSPVRSCLRLIPALSILSCSESLHPPYHAKADASRNWRRQRMRKAQVLSSLRQPSTHNLMLRHFQADTRFSDRHLLFTSSSPALQYPLSSSVKPAASQAGRTRAQLLQRFFAGKVPLFHFSILLAFYNTGNQ